MSFGFPAYHTEHYETNCTREQFLADVERSFKTLRWKIRFQNEHKIIAGRRLSPFSWGERIIIEFYENNTLSITSRCVLVTQCFDWGKNKRNIDAFIDELERQL